MDFRSETPWAVISIKNHDQIDNVFDCPNLKHALWMAFDDADHLIEGMVIFTMPMAKQIWDFVESLEGIDTLVIHCNMGFSRSPAVAAAIDKVRIGDDSTYFEKKSPNRRVYRAMLHEAQRRGLVHA